MGKVRIYIRRLKRYQSLSRHWKRSFLDQGRTPDLRLLIPVFGGRKTGVSCSNQVGDAPPFRFMNPGHFSEIPHSRPHILPDSNLKISKSTSQLPLWPRRHRRPLLLLAFLRRKTFTTTSDLTQRSVFSGSIISSRSEDVSVTPFLKFDRLSTNRLQYRWWVSALNYVPPSTSWHSATGIMRSFLVYPTFAVYPQLMPMTQLFDALHRGKEAVMQKKRLKFFWLIFVAIFVWEWFPVSLLVSTNALTLKKACRSILPRLFPSCPGIYSFLRRLDSTLTGISVFCLANQKSAWFTRVFGAPYLRPLVVTKLTQLH